MDEAVRLDDVLKDDEDVMVGEFVDGRWQVTDRNGKVVASASSLPALVLAVAPDVLAEDLELLEHVGRGEGRTCNLRRPT